MSKLLKSKILLGVFAFAVMLFVASSALAADGAITKTLKYGMKDVQVKYLQQTLNEKGFTVAAAGKTGSAGFESTYFGNATKAAVKAFQAAKGLVADGVFGAKSRAGLGGVVMTYPAGCTSAVGFSPTTGLPCTAITTPVTTYPAGCTSAVGFSSTTGASCATGVVTNTGPVTVTLATDNPATGSFIAPASGVEFAKYTFTGTGTVTSVKLMRTGVSASTTLSNAYLYDGTTRLTDGASISSDNTVTFNTLSGIFSVAGTKTITVVADTLVADYSLGFTLVGYTANGTAVTANVVGNQMFGASATLAKATMSAALGSGNTDAGVDVTVWQGTATVDTRDVLLKRLALRQLGSIVSADINNFKLYADGVLVTTVANLDANGYVTFATSYALKSGARILKVTADVLGGSGRTVQMSLRGTYDLITTDTQYNANGTTAGTFPFGPAAFTVNAGTLTVVKKSDSQSSNVTRGVTDQSLASYTFTAYGEPIKVETLKVGMVTTAATVTDVTLRNVRILVNGAQVGSNTSVPAAATFAANSGTAFTTNFVVYPGTPATVEIHSDLVDTTDAGGDIVDSIASGATTTIQAILVGGAASANATPQVSLGTINVPSTANVAGNNLTISAGSMTVAKTSSYANQLTSYPSTAYKIGSFQLTGNSTEAINLNTIYVGWTTASTILEATELSDLYVVYGGTQSTVKGTVVASDVAATASDNSNSWSINKVLGKNETMSFDVYATIGSSLTGTKVINPTLAVAGTTASSGIAVYADTNTGNTTLDAGVTGQTVTGAAGTLVLSQDASTALAQLVDDGSASVKSLTAKLVATTDSYTVTDMTVTVTEVTAVSTVTLKDHDTGLVIGAAKPSATSMTWSGLSFPVTAGTTKKVDVELALSPIGVGAGSTDDTLTTAITEFTARDSAGASQVRGASGSTASGTATGNAIYIYKAVPLVSLVALPNSTLAGGEMVIAKFTVSSNGTGTVAWKQALLEITKSAAPTLSAATLWNSDTGLQVNAFMEYQNGGLTGFNAGGGTASTCVADVAFCELRITIDASASDVTDDDYTEQVSGAKTYEVRSTIGGTLAAGNSVSVKFDRNTTTHADSAAYVTNDNGGGVGGVSFTWSDESLASGDTGVATWQKDYLIKNLPITWNLNRN
ncbi:MAG: peptidoglycan-binding domain-containing protein [Candidatus Nomurabacteria bacterium]|nr:peptidoglycan-binding domain-containing protein [Candidatus Nomurabacteria bacterium]